MRSLFILYWYGCREFSERIESSIDYDQLGYFIISINQCAETDSPSILVCINFLCREAFSIFFFFKVLLLYFTYSYVVVFAQCFKSTIQYIKIQSKQERLVPEKPVFKRFSRFCSLLQCILENCVPFWEIHRYLKNNLMIS